MRDDASLYVDNLIFPTLSLISLRYSNKVLGITSLMPIQVPSLINYSCMDGERK